MGAGFEVARKDAGLHDRFVEIGWHQVHPVVVRVDQVAVSDVDATDVDALVRFFKDERLRG